MSGQEFYRLTEGGRVGGERSVLSRSPEQQSFLVLWSRLCRIPLGWALVHLGEDYGKQSMETYLGGSM